MAADIVVCHGFHNRVFDYDNPLCAVGCQENVHLFLQALGLFYMNVK